MNFVLSSDQLSAIHGITNTLCNNDPNTHSLAVLTGSAGTGKTTVVAEIIRYIRKNNNANIELCASTNRAAEVLKDIVGLDTSTAHKLFKLRPGVTAKGQEELIVSGPCEISNGSVVIIDEASMIGNKFLKAIVPIIKNKALNILFVGDHYQLPPMSDKCSIFDGTLPTYTLTKVHRQKGDNPILDKAIEYRNYIENPRLPFPVLQTEVNALGEGIHVLPHSLFVSNFVKKYMDYTAGGEVDIPLCTYTNDSAINYNSMVRKAAYFLEGAIEPFYKGERLVSNSIVKHDRTILLSNNEVVFVQKYSPTTLYDIPGYTVVVKGDHNRFTKTDIKPVFAPRSKAEADKVLNELKKVAKQGGSKANWVTFYKVKNMLADLRPPFAGTTHKAQGGTFPAVFIDQVNINKCRDQSVKARLMYVALTRASKYVYVNT